MQDSPAHLAGIAAGDEICLVNGTALRDVIDYELSIYERDPELTLSREGRLFRRRLLKAEGEPAGIRFSEALFDGVRHCNNKCEFCFVHQLPAGLRSSLYEKDDDYRLSFLYGNFTTLTRFTEYDLERVLRDRISPIYVSIHSAEPELRARILRNRKGGYSLRWLAPLLQGGIEIHGQIVLCSGLNSGAELDRTLEHIGAHWPEISSVGVVPVGVGKHYSGKDLRALTQSEMRDTLAQIARWQRSFLGDLGRRMVFAADEFYLHAGAPLPPAEEYEGFPQYENGIGMARSLIDEARTAASSSHQRNGDASHGGRLRQARVVITGTLGASVIRTALADLTGDDEVEVLAVPNRFFGGNVAVTGLLTGVDVKAAMKIRTARERGNARKLHFLIPASIVPAGRTLDCCTVDDLIQTAISCGASAEIVPVDGGSLVDAVLGRSSSASESAQSVHVAAGAKW